MTTGHARCSCATRLEHASKGTSPPNSGARQRVATRKTRHLARQLESTQPEVGCSVFACTLKTQPFQLNAYFSVGGT